MGNNDQTKPGGRTQGRGHGLQGPEQPELRTLRPVQEKHDEDHQGAGTTAPEEAEGVLEDSDGVVWLFKAGERVARISKPRLNLISGLYFSRRRGEEFLIEWRRWQFDRLSWTYKFALFFLQGASIQQLIGDRYIVLKASPDRPFVPFFGIKGVVMAEIFAAPSELSRMEVFELLMPEAWGA